MKGFFPPLPSEGGKREVNDVRIYFQLKEFYSLDSHAQARNF